MQRWCSKLRSLAALYTPSKPQPPYIYTSIPSCDIHISANSFHKPVYRSVISPSFKPLLNASHISHPALPAHSSLLAFSIMQVRYITAKQRKRKLKSRKPMTPVISKVKKIKMKFYSSFKGRFRVMNDGKIRRWKAGKQHNAHSKSKKARRRLRRPGTVPLAYAKVMKKLNFCG